MRDVLKTLKRRNFFVSSVAYVLAFAILLSSVAGITIFAGNISKPSWNGSAEDLTGSGSASDPYVIKTGGQLYKAVTLGSAATKGKYFVLANDIYLNEVGKADWKDTARTWTVAKADTSGNFDTADAFAGHFDGKGYVVHGLYIDEKTSYTNLDAIDTSVAAGLFPLLAGGATVTSVGVEDSYISVTTNANSEAAKYGGYVGAIAGLIVGNSADEKVNISLCYADTTTHIAGGHLGLANIAVGATGAGIIMSNSYATMGYTAYTYSNNENRPSLISGDNSAVVFKGCYTLYNPYGDNGAAASSSENNYYGTDGWALTTTTATHLANNDMQGTSADEKMGGLDFVNTYIVTSYYPVLRVFIDAVPSKDDIDVWDGTIATHLVGYGTDADHPYFISNAEELAYVINNGGAANTFYKFTRDIYLNDITVANWKTAGANREWFENKAVQGTFDGDGHTVYGLWYPADNNSGASTDSYVGLFPKAIGNLTIKNLAISEAQVVTKGAAGAFVGGAIKASGFNALVIDKCYSDESVYVRTLGGDSHKSAGGILGVAWGTGINVSISNTYSVADFFDWGQYNNCGAIVGEYWGNGSNLGEFTVTDCYGIVKLAKTDKVYLNINFTDCYCGNDVNTSFNKDSWTYYSSTATIKGESALTNMPGLSADVWVVTEGYPTLKVFIEDNSDDDDDVPTGPIIWGGQTDLSEPTDSDGDGKIEIGTGAELAWVVNNGGAANAEYIFTSDIYLNDVSEVDWKTSSRNKEWFENKLVQGTFDGDGHTVYGLWYPADNNSGASTDSYVGLFPRANANLTIKNLAISQAQVVTCGAAGAFVGGAIKANGFSSLLIDKCYSDESVYVRTLGGGSHKSAGGILGVAWGTGINVSISNTYSVADFFDWGQYNNCGAIVGEYWGNGSNLGEFTVTDCYGIVKLAKTDKVYLNINFTDCYCGNDVNTSFNKDSWTYYSSIAAIKGASALENMPGLDTEIWTTTSGYPTLKMFVKDTSDDDDSGNQGGNEGGNEGGGEPDEPADNDRPVVWDGHTLTEPNGSGTKADPYRIASADNLAYILVNGSSPTAYYIFTNDIYINDVTKIDWTNGNVLDSGYTPNAWYLSPDVQKIQGNIDGNGKIVYGLYYKQPNNTRYTNGAALFPSYGLVHVKDLGMDNCYVEYQSNYSLAAMFGKCDSSSIGSTIDGCYLGAGVKVKGYDAAGFFGGGDPVSAATDKVISITNCLSLATIEASHSKNDNNIQQYRPAAGAFYGDNWSNLDWVVNNSLAINAPASFQNLHASSMNVYSTVEKGTVVSADAIKGENAKNLMPGLDWDNYFITVENDYPQLRRFYRYATNEYWSGGTSEPVDVDNDGYYEISTPEELAWVVKNGGNKKYNLTEDIYLNDINAITWSTGVLRKEMDGTEYQVKSWYTSNDVAPFSGELNGNGFKIYGLYYKNTTTTPSDVGVGLFPLAGNGINVNKVAIEKAYLEQYSNSGLGVIIGKTPSTVSGTVSESYVGETVTVKGYDAGAIVGGGAREADFTVENCYSLATLNFTNKGGLVGNSAKVGSNTAKWLVNKVYAAGYEIKNGTGSDGVQIAGEFEAVSVTNSYAAKGQASGVTVITLSEMKGLDALTEKMANLGDAFRATEGFPMLEAFVPVTPPPQAGVWDGATVTPITLGEGTQEEPYLIHNAAELAYLVQTGGIEGKYYKLVYDIYINEVDNIDWATGQLKTGITTPINSWVSGSAFKGVLDGDGKRIYGLYINIAGDKTAANSGAGLFTEVGANATIKNVGIDKAYVNNKNAAAAFVGYSSATKLTITDCYVGSDVTISGYASAAFVGITYKPFDFERVYNWGTLVANEHTWNPGTGVTTRDGITGLFGDIWGNGENQSSVMYSYNATGAINTKTYVNKNSKNFAIAGGRSGITQVTVEEMQGLEVFNNGKPMQELNGDKKWQATASFPILDIFAEDPNGPDGDEFVPDTGVDEYGVWTGKVLELFADESAGTEDDPIIISNPGELALAISSNGKGKYYKLANDIYLNEVRLTNGWYKNEGLNEWVKCTGFNGHIDGAGYCVYGIWNSENNTGSAGLISVMDAGSIKNLGIRYSYIRTTQSGVGAGGLIGRAKALAGTTTIEQCFVDETVTVISNPAGGLVGLAMYPSQDTTRAQGLKIINCYSKAALVCNNDTKQGGLIGNPWVTAYEIYNSYSVGYKPYSVNNDGEPSCLYWTYDTASKTGVQKDGKKVTDFFKNIYTDTGASDGKHNIWTALTNQSMHGLEASKYMSNLDFKNVWVAVKDGTPILKVFEGRISGADIDVSMDAEIFTKGSGKKNDPYLVENVAQLRYLVQSMNTKGKYYALANDIYVNDTSKKNWMLNKPALWYKDLTGVSFEGTFDGNGHAIYGLYMNETPSDPEKVGAANYVSGSAVGLFPYVNTTAVIRNVHIRNSYLSGRGNVGAIAGHLIGKKEYAAEFIGCSVDESVVLRGFTVGGLIGAGSATPVNIYYSYCTADIKNTGTEDRANGLVGDIWSAKINVMNSYVVGYDIARGDIPMKIALYSDVFGGKATYVETAKMYGSAAKTSMPDLEWGKVWYTAKGKTPQLKYVDYNTRPIQYDEGVKGRVWSGGLATKYAGGTGTEEDPYIIETPEQLAKLIFDGSSKNTEYYKLVADIKLNDTSKANWQQRAKEWFSGTTFAGTFDGNGHVVTGLYFNQADSGECALFPEISYNTTIKRLGIASSSIVNTLKSSASTIAGALIGNISNWDGLNGVNNTDLRDAPIISECFVAADVLVSAGKAGGLIGNTSANFEIYNCYVLADIRGTEYFGGLFGYGYENDGVGLIVENCYVATVNRDPYGQGAKATGIDTFIKNVYVDGASTLAGNGVTKATSLNYMKSSNVKEYLIGFDWDKVWKTVNGGTPVLRCFKNAEKYSCKRDAVKVSISFSTGFDASQHEPIWGYPLESKIDMSLFPTPTRYGYKFVGWSLFDTGDVDFNLEVFPNYNMYAFAKWEKIGFEQGFEGAMYPEYDVNEGAQYFRPGVDGYNPRYVHGGLRTMQVLSNSKTAPMFLLNYEDTLEIGQKYSVTFYMSSGTDGATGKVEFLHANYADVNDIYVGYETVSEFSNLKSGIWQEYSCEITANSPYIVVRTTPGVELYFDDFRFIPLGEEGTLGELEGYNPNGVGNSPFGANILWFIIPGVIVLLGGVAVVVVLLIKRKKK